MRFFFQLHYKQRLTRNCEVSSWISGFLQYSLKHPSENNPESCIHYVMNNKDVVHPGNKILRQGM